MRRKYDLVVLGATGFTGRRVLEYLIHLKGTQNLSIGAAGRNETKIRQLLSQEDAEERVQAIVTDVQKPEQLLSLAQDSSIILNCVGPYRYTGEGVVAACVSAGTDYLDVSGEPEFMERAEMRFHNEARANQCFVVSACGFDSVPADLGTLYVQQKFALPNSVEAFLSIKAPASGLRANYATWESAVHGFGSADSLRSLRKRRLAELKSGAHHKPAGPKLKAIQAGSFDKSLDAYLVPFPGSDASVVKRTQRTIGVLGEDTVHFAAAVCIKSAWNLLLLGFFSFVFTSLAAFQLGRQLLLSFPELFSWGIFTRQGPTHEQMESTSFRMLLIGRGFTSGADATAGKLPDKEVRVEVSGPDPGYIATPIFLVQAALVLLQEREVITSRLGPGGVFTPGAAFGKSSYIDRIKQAGISFKEVSDVSG